MKEDTSRSCSEKSVVLTETNIFTGVNFGSSLADDNFTGLYKLAAESLYTQSLSIGISSVFGASSTFLMSHYRFLTFASI